MKLINYLIDSQNPKEITEKLMTLDGFLREIHSHNYYVIGNIGNLDVFDDLTWDSFKNKMVSLDDDYNSKGKEYNILNAAILGVCAYNNIDVELTSSFQQYVCSDDGINKLLKNGKIPNKIQDYYLNVIYNLNFEYLNDFINKLNGGKGNVNSKSYTKSTAAGRIYANKYLNKEENAYVNILILPSIFVLIYLIIIVVSFILKN